MKVNSAENIPVLQENFIYQHLNNSHLPQTATKIFSIHVYLISL